MDVKTIEEPEEESELMRLLVKNTRDGLTAEEEMRALRLIGNPEYPNAVCRLCRRDNPDTTNKAIYNTGMCQDHAFYALATRK